jgi:UDP-N-acetylmuramate dehydrogenase
MASVVTLKTDSLSYYRTEHTFLHYAEFKTVEEYIALRQWARGRDIPLFILGNGSNTFFAHGTIRTLVLRNRMPPTMDALEAGETHRIEASSSLMVARLLHYCQQHKLDSCYYLASVPATVGGALAMNAGRGRQHQSTIFDFVETVTYLDEDELRTVHREAMSLQYRTTMFTGVQDKLILGAVFAFPRSEKPELDLIRSRLQYSKEKQDYSAHNCGSVFKEYSGLILRLVRGLRIGKSWYSSKTSNWLLTRARSPRSLRALITLARLLHRITFRRVELEIIEVQ